MSFARLQTRTRSSSAFTLVELMIVIAIVGILATLVTVGVMKALEKGKMVAARTEISQIEAAIAAAKQKYSLDQLPQALVLYDNLPDWERQSSASYVSTNFPAALSPLYSDAQKMLIVADSLNLMKKIFGRNFLKDAAGGANGRVRWTAGAATYPIALGSNQAIWFLLGGVLDANGKYGGFPGYPNEPTMTLSNVAATKPILPFLEMESSKISVGTNGFGSYLDSYGTPYAFFSSKYNYCNFPNSITGFGVQYLGSFSHEGKTVWPFYNPIAGTPTNWTQVKFFNPRSFQVVSAGADKIFGSNQNSATGTPIPYQPGSNEYALGEVGYDDLANFSSTTLGKRDE